MCKFPVISLTLLYSCFAMAQRQAPFELLKNDSLNLNHVPVFRSYDALYLSVINTIDQVIIRADTRPVTGKWPIWHWLSRHDLTRPDTLHAGVFTFPGLYVINAYPVTISPDPAARAGYHFVHWEDILPYQRSGYIAYRYISRGYKGLSWRVGDNFAQAAYTRTYLYCYGPGHQYTSSDTSVLDVPNSPCSLTPGPIDTLTDSLVYAFNNINPDSLQTKLSLKADSLAARDNLQQISFSFYMDADQPVRLLVYGNNSIGKELLKEKCRETFYMLVDLLCDRTVWDFKIKDAFGNLPDKMFTDATKEQLCKTICGLFDICPGYVFDRKDTTNTAAALAALSGSYINGDNTIYAGVLNGHASGQIVLFYTVTGKNYKPDEPVPAKKAQ